MNFRTIRSGWLDGMRGLCVAAAVFAALALPAAAGQFGARSMAGWFSVTSEDGWRGRRYVDGNTVFAEEFDSAGGGKIDVWRFYRRGVLSSEERDLNGDGRIDFVTRWDSHNQTLNSMARDTAFRGMNNLEMDVVEGGNWQIREDRNGDGVADRILLASGPYDFFSALALDLSIRGDVIGAVPMEYWLEYGADDGFTGSITDHRRYQRGAQTHYGVWEETQIVWYRGDGPAPPQVAALPAPGPAQQYRYNDAGDPWDSTGQAGGYVAPTYGDPFVDTSPISTTRDRTRYDGLPPGESAARSLPARMRPPGVGR